MSFIPISLVIVYMIILLLIVYKMRGVQKTFEEYGTANRSMGLVIVAFTIIGTWFTGTGWTGWMGMSVSMGFIGQYGVVYSTIMLIFVYLIAPRTWLWGKKYNLISYGDFFLLRYGSYPLKMVGGILSLLYAIPFFIVEFVTLGYIVNYLTYQNIPIPVGTVVLGGFVLGYVALGGMRGVVLTDFFQGLLFTIGGTAMVLFIVHHYFGGFGPAYARMLVEMPQNLTVPGSGWNPGPYYWSSIILVSAIGGFIGPPMLTRSYVADSVKTIKRSLFFVPVIAIILGILQQMVGMFAGLLPEVKGDVQGAFLWMAGQGGGPWLLGITGVLILAAAMSTTDTMVASVGINTVRDIIMPFKRDLSDAKAIKTARWSIIIIGALSLYLATLTLPMLFQVALFAYQVIVQFAPAIIGGLYWKRANVQGALAGTVVGAIFALTLEIKFPGFIPALGGVTGGTVGLIVNVIIFIACGYIFKAQSNIVELFKVFENVKKSTNNVTN